jgi:hypothetical protein
VTTVVAFFARTIETVSEETDALSARARFENEGVDKSSHSKTKARPPDGAGLIPSEFYILPATYQPNPGGGGGGGGGTGGGGGNGGGAGSADRVRTADFFALALRRAGFFLAARFADFAFAFDFAFGFDFAFFFLAIANPLM